MDEPDTGACTPPGNESAAPLITARGLGLNGEHGPLFSGVDLELRPGFHAIRMPGGPSQHTLLLTLAGRLKPTHGTVSVYGETTPRDIRRHCAIAAFADIDELEEMVTVRTVLTEQRRWVAPWFSWVPEQRTAPEYATAFGDLEPPEPGRFIIELSDLDLFLLRISLALMSDRPVLVVGDLEQVRDNARRALAVERLAAIARKRTVIVGVTNPLDHPEGNDLDIHEHPVAAGRD